MTTAGLPTRTLGRTGLQVSVLGYGAMELRGDARGRRVGDKQAGQVLNAVLDAGINFIDTSIEYGASEERIGRHIAHRRQEFILATKCGCSLDEKTEGLKASVIWFLRRNLRDTGTGRTLRRLLFPSGRRVEPPPDRHDFTPANIVAGIEQSLRRLQTDYVDLLQIHHPPSRADLERHGTVDAMLALKQQGKVRFLGISSRLPDALDHVAMGVFDVIQLPYSAFDREHEAVLSAAAAAGIGTIVRGGTGGTGRGGLTRAPEVQQAWQRANLGALLGQITPMELNLRLVQASPDVSLILVGTADASHLRQNVTAAARGPLPQDLAARVTRALASVS
jgi:aryl-alcohol dehydrogenase-like predicted oxidoreductase